MKKLKGKERVKENIHRYDFKKRVLSLDAWCKEEKEQKKPREGVEEMSEVK